MLTLSRVQQSLCEVLGFMGLQKDVEVTAVENERVFLDFDQDKNFPSLADNMIKIEKAMKLVLGVKHLDLRLISLSDRNKRDQKSGRGTTGNA